MHTLGRLHGRFQLQRLFLPSSFSFSSSLVSPKLTRTSSTRSAGPPPLQYQVTKTYSDHRYLCSDMISLLSSMSRAESLNSSMEILGKHKEPLSVSDRLQVLKVVSQMSSRGKASIKSSLLKNNETFQKLCNDIMRDVHLLSLPDLVQLLSYFGKLRTNINPRAAGTVLSLMEKSSKSLSELSPEEIGSIVNSLALFNINTGWTDFINHIAAIVARQLTSETFNCHISLREICKGFAILRRWPKQLTDPLLGYLYRSIDVMDDYSVANIIRSLQTSNIPLEDWLFEKASTLILESKSTSVVSHLLWVSGNSMHYYNKEFYDKMREILLSSDSRHWYDPRLLSDMLWMLARVRHYDPVLMDKAAQVALPLLCRMDPQSLSLFVYAYGYFNHPSPALFEALEDLLVSYGSTYVFQNSRSFRTIFWSFLVLELYPVPLIEQVFKDEFIEANIFSVIIQQLDNASMTNPHLSLPSLSPSQRSSILSHILLAKHSSFRSKFEKDLTESLNMSLNSSKGDTSNLFNPEKLFITEALMPNGYSVDAEILLDANDDPIPPGNENFKWSLAGLKQLCMEDVPVPQERLSRIFNDTKSRGEGLYNISSGWIDGGKVAAAKRRIIIEFEGPFHYAVNSHHELGRSVIKRRQLEAFGWEFIQVPYYEWEPLGNDYALQSEYLKNKLASSTRSAGPPPLQHQVTKTYSNMISLLSSMSQAESLNSSMEILGKHKEPLSVSDRLQVLKAVSQMSSQEKASIKSSPLKNNKTFQNLCNDIMRDVHLLSLPDLVQLLSYFGKLRTNINPRAAGTVLSLIEESSGKSLSELPPEDIGSIVNSLALFKINTGWTDFINHIAAIIAHQLTSETFDCHNWLRDICRDFAILGRWPKQLTDPLINYLYRSIDVMDDYSVARIIWSLQKSNIPLEDWLFEKASTLILESKSTSVVSHLLWVSGKSMHYYNKEFYDKMREILLSSDSRHWYDPRLLSHMLWMLARVRHYDPVLLDRAAQVALPLLCRMEPQSLSLFVYAYGYFNHPSPALFEALEDFLVSYGSTYAFQDSQGFRTILWSFLVLELYPVPLIEQVFKDEFIKANKGVPRLTVQLDNASMTNPHLSLPSLSPSQHFSILPEMVTKKPIKKLRFAAKNVTETLNKLLHSSKGGSSNLFNPEKLFITEALMPNGYSVDAEILLDANDDPIPPGNENFKWSLAGLKQLCMEDVPVPQEKLSRIFYDTKSRGEGLYNISSGWIDGGRVAAAKRRIIIEFEGPSHYAVNSHHELGRSVIKRRQLEAFGWEFIQVPYYEWEPLGNDYALQSEYLKNKLFTKKDKIKK